MRSVLLVILLFSIGGVQSALDGRAATSIKVQPTKNLPARTKVPSRKQPAKVLTEPGKKSPARAKALIPSSRKSPRPLLNSHALSPPIFTGVGQSYGPVGDFTGDGKTDLFAVTRTGRDIIWQIAAAGRGPFKTINQFKVGPHSENMATTLRFADFNGNGIVDVLHMNTQGDWFVTEDGKGTPKHRSRLKVSLKDLGIGDFNGDGESDLLKIDRNGQWLILPSGSGSWKNLGRFGGLVSDLRFADFTGDGTTDALRIDARGNWSLLDLKVRRWTPVNRQPERLADLHVADFNSDGAADVAVWRKGQWFYAAGAKGNWQGLGRIAVDARSGRPADFNGDGQADLFYLESAGRATRWLSSAGYRGRPVVLHTVPTSDARHTPAEKPTEGDHDSSEASSEHPTGNTAGATSGPITGAPSTPNFQPGLRMSEAPARCRIQTAQINGCVLANGYSRSAVADQVQRLQGAAIHNCCAALARVQQAAGSALCPIITPELAGQLGCLPP